MSEHGENGACPPWCLNRLASQCAIHRSPAEKGSGHWGDGGRTERHAGTPGECEIPTCIATPPRACPCLSGAPNHACGTGGYLADPLYICYPCSRGEHAEHRRIAWEHDIPCECTCVTPPEVTS